ncbi:hypothetical protein [Dyadobacter sp. BHUBP1]
MKKLILLLALVSTSKRSEYHREMERNASRPGNGAPIDLSEERGRY